jgi:hypothetical protein
VQALVRAVQPVLARALQPLARKRVLKNQVPMPLQDLALSRQVMQRVLQELAQPSSLACWRQPEVDSQQRSVGLVPLLPALVPVPLPVRAFARRQMPELRRLLPLGKPHHRHHHRQPKRRR